MTHKDSIKERWEEEFDRLFVGNEMLDTLPVTPAQDLRDFIRTLRDEAKAEEARERDEGLHEMLLKLDQDGGYDEAWYSAIKMVRSLLSPRSKDGDVE